ncbi:hypothetical protein TIFTF001_008298 [Ficus carica]|uniref:Uncharacterized protein n=1 Tax=Ficus carica TaxID=3494 RepID=A0AA87ZMS5_FICCA|nr:hypothetical protein TIFTF001_008298 [Ficus carica]
MSSDDHESKELPELTHQLQGGKKGVDDEVVVQEQRLLEENELRSSCAPADVKDGQGRAGQGRVAEAQAVPQVSQQPPQEAMVCWERFLHLRSLKFLLVENDDSTRHIVTALLRNCSYEGIGLLCKIMSHRTRKNVPVIMMSSHDSMGLVFKCLSKGAVDFLVKPIRKNELKNLWQHVWRRCHSSSWTKQAVEVDSPKQTSSWGQMAECPDSTCARVVHPNAEIGGENLVSREECPEQNEKIDGGAMGKDLEIGMASTLKVPLEYLNECPTKYTVTRQNNLVEMGSNRFNEQINKGLVDFDHETPSRKLSCESHTLTDEMPSLELSLKRLRGVKGTGTTVQDDRNVLRRSDSSAFSRYNGASNADKAPTGGVGNSVPRDNSIETTKKEFHDIQTSGNPPNHSATFAGAASNNIDVCYTTGHGMQQQQPTDHNDFSLKKLATAAPHCGSSNVLSGPVEGNTGNYSINRSGWGSNHGSNAAINIGGTNVKSDHGGSGKSGSGDASESGRADGNKSALREAALTKFHQKKKERCFRKRVRYQSRKKLAEQRPRIQGQFVRETTASESTSKATDS